MDLAGLSDDASIAESARLLQRIPPWHFVYDSNSQRWRPSSAAFDNDSDDTPMSVMIESIVVDSGRLPDAVL